MGSFYRPLSSAKLQQGREMLMSLGKQEFSRQNGNNSGRLGAQVWRADLQWQAHPSSTLELPDLHTHIKKALSALKQLIYNHRSKPY